MDFTTKPLTLLWMLWVAADSLSFCGLRLGPSPPATGHLHPPRVSSAALSFATLIQLLGYPLAILHCSDSVSAAMSNSSLQVPAMSCLQASCPPRAHEMTLSALAPSGASNKPTATSTTPGRSSQA
ncbi:hypothetical protein BT67DRAFT_437815 [Trichocladium antarcticum]|uniref:Uncharacterized protein n=1 Tax=Trichocladium antarcticum TaxID=1450529 RepID=A0AAN6ZHD3_9PEZI|nr:hypothetical protein BT67DRAFT_437815 [Trichocladium antarcticum]